PRSQLDTNKETNPHPTTPSASRSDALTDPLPPFFRSQFRTNEEIDLSQRASRPHVDVAPMRDRDVLFVAPQVQLDRPHPQSAGTTTPGAKPAHSRPVRLLGNIGLFFCCACNHQHTDGDAQPTQQPQGQS
ncbi:hypothetical protein P692DRAFT_20746012, partial [Suillus brevipes Sb2]